MIWIVYFLMGFGIGAIVAKDYIGYRRMKKDKGL